MTSGSPSQTGPERQPAAAGSDLAPSPLDAAFGIVVAAASAGTARLTAPPRSTFANGSGVLHGGWVATLLDAAAGAAVESLLTSGQRYLTLNLNVSYFRAVQPGDAPAVANGEVVRRGRRVMTSEARLYDHQSELCALGVATCLILPSS